MTENTPQRIGDYEIIRELGHGGMGKVYQVRNVISDRVEAMKVVLPDLANRSEFATRFMREIKVLASLDHPNIAQLRTAFTADDQLVMIMEYVDGVTLGDRLEREGFPVLEALNYIDQVLAALSYAHGKHVIHRDIKPGNMMLTPQGVVKLMDFGLARSSNEVGLTMTGTTVGSLDFMSPEQVQSQPTDERSDLYAVGVSLYQMVTHQRMFNATSNYSIMEAHVKETPRPPIEIKPTVPKGLSDLIMMSVAKDPAQRFQTADAFRNALAQVLASLVEQAGQPTVSISQAHQAASPGGPATPPPAVNVATTPSASSATMAPPAPARGGRGVLLAVAAVVLLAVLAGAWMYKSRQQHETLAANVTSAPAGTSQQSSATPASNPPAQDANPPAPATLPPPAPAPAPHKRASSGAAGLMPGGAAPDTQAEQDAAAAAAAQKKLLDDMETEDDHLEGRAAAIESSMDNLEQQMRASGYGMRGDMVAARGNMRNDLAKAKQAMDSADTDRARHYLDLAHREVEKLEAFLGRR